MEKGTRVFCVDDRGATVDENPPCHDVQSTGWARYHVLNRAGYARATLFLKEDDYLAFGYCSYRINHDASVPTFPFKGLWNCQEFSRARRFCGYLSAREADRLDL